MRAPYYDLDTACIPALHQPALVYEYARGLDIDARTLCAGTGLGPEHFCAAPEVPGGIALSPAQTLRLLGNAVQALDSPETSFMLGRQWLPGHYDAASLALLHAGSLREALTLLVQCQARLCPLLAPRLVADDKLAVLSWTEACGLGWLKATVVEMHMVAVLMMSRRLAGERLPWTCCLNRTAPRRREAHEVHLGANLRFDCHLDAMLIDAAWLDRPWPRPAGQQAARLALDSATQGPQPRGLLAALYAHLLAEVGRAPTLDQTAAAFGLSPATFKRRLAAHGTHYQAELDLVRSHVALYLFHFEGCSNEAVARRLGFHDATNFRRSFKRWTGLTPGLLRAGLGMVG